jgi:hypothetical protein
VFTLDVDARVSGPVFDGRAEAAIERGISEGIWAVAKEGRGDLGVQFLKVFKEPTGNYEGHVRAERTAVFESQITDQGIDVYNYWLEGKGSRNFPVTRFKGYRSFEIIAGRLEHKAKSIVERHIAAQLRAVSA